MHVKGSVILESDVNYQQESAIKEYGKQIFDRIHKTKEKLVFLDEIQEYCLRQFMEMWYCKAQCDAYHAEQAGDVLYKGCYAQIDSKIIHRSNRSMVSELESTPELVGKSETFPIDYTDEVREVVGSLRRRTWKHLP